VWQEAMDLAVATYRLTSSFPREEVYGLTSQLRRSAASVPANIAEGYGRNTTGSYVQFLNTSRGSLNELETHLLLSDRLGLVQRESIDEIVSNAMKLGKQISALIRSLKSSDARCPCLMP
jgi:four helix bundle protein